jgi:hypothetical protein
MTSHLLNQYAISLKRESACTEVDIRAKNPGDYLSKPSTPQMHSRTEGLDQTQQYQLPRDSIVNLFMRLTLFTAFNVAN